MELAESLNDTAGVTVLIRIHPGVYTDSCRIRQSNIYIEWLPGAYHIVPGTAGGATAVVGGLLTIASFPYDPNIAPRVVNAGFINPAGVNYGWGAPEAFIDVGGSSGNSAASWNNVSVIGGEFAGNHDCLHVTGSRLTNDTDLPILKVRDVNAFGGADCLVLKGWLDDRTFIEGNFSTITNFCEADPNTVELDAVTGTVVSGTTTTVVIDAADASVPSDFYWGRKISFADVVSGCTADGEYAFANNFDPNTDTITFTPAVTAGMDTNCAYTIAAVPNQEQNCIGPASTHQDWNTFRINHRKCGPFHLGPARPSAPSGAGLTIGAGSSFYTEINDTCADDPNSEWAYGILLGKDNDDYGTVTIQEGVTVNVEVNYDLANGSAVTSDPNTWSPNIVGITTEVQTQGIFNIGANVKVVNNAAVTSHIAGIAVSVNDPNRSDIQMNVSSSDISVVDNIGTAGVQAPHLWGSAPFASYVDNFLVGNVTSPELLRTVGHIQGWSERCFTFPDFVAATDDQPIPISDAAVGLRLAYGGCRCLGTCGAAESITFEDDAGNQIHTGAVTCVDNTADMTWTDVRGDADGLIPASKSPRFDTTVESGTGTDDLQVCARYSTSRFAP
jgi:hypothetical protein